MYPNIWDPTHDHSCRHVYRIVLRAMNLFNSQNRNNGAL